MRSCDVFGDVFWKESTLARACANVRALTYCDLHIIRREALMRVLEFYTAFANSFSRNLILTCNLRKRVIFRKIADVKREKERQKSEVALSIPEDHPVRKLFQRFKQQRDSQALDQNCVQVEPEHHPHTDSNPCNQRQTVPSQQQEHNNKPSAGRGSVSGMAMPQQAFMDAGMSEQSCTGGAGAEGAAGLVNSGRSVRGWAKFRSAMSKAEEWPNAPQASEESGEAGEETSVLHKTDSCDSGITKSDLRIDRAGDSRSSFERSPMERSPLERSPPSFLQPVSEQSLLQVTLHEAKLELKADIRKLSSRLSLLESQVSEILRLLSMKRRLSLPPTPSKPRIKRHNSGSVSRLVAPKAEEETFEFTQE
uniref:Potassium voltage-gated channel subfamily H member 5 n=1 Tax=Kryptolebias marmoratus TaxID=37003 RepID=A0A3Q3AKL1_KRYMA